MPNTYINKVILGTEVKLDLTGDDIKPEHLKKNIKAHDKSGAPIVGTNTYDADTTDATATAAEILATKTAYVNGAKVVGSMPNRGAQHLKISKLDTPVTIQGGYHDGSGDASVDSVEAAKIIPKNIREGITILGVTGNMSGSEGMKPQAKNVTPSFEAQVISPDEGYNCLSEVTVAAIPYSEVDNDFGGKTLTIGG